MKKLMLFACVVTLAMLLTSCGHNVGLVGIGTGWRVGNGEYGLAYGDGIFGTFVTKDGVKFKAELDSTTGFSYDPSSNTYKGIKSFEYSLPPQITGYAVDFAKDNPDVAKSYYEALVKYYEVKSTDVGAKQHLITEEKSKSATQEVAEILKKAVDAAKGLIKKKTDTEGEEATFQCNGNCNYDDLTGNADITYQLSIAMKLLTYNGYAKKFESTGEYYTTTLEHFVTQLVTHQAKGETTTPLRVKYVTVENGDITRLMYIMIEEDGRRWDVECPSCIGY